VVDAPRRGHDVTFHKLQAEGFDPVAPAEELSRDVKLPTEIIKTEKNARLVCFPLLEECYPRGRVRPRLAQIVTD